MIKASYFIKKLIDNEFVSFYGVPDSLLSTLVSLFILITMT